MSRLLHEIEQSWIYLRKHGLVPTLTAKDVPLLLQFSKYVGCGLVSLVIFIIVVLVGNLWFPDQFSADLPQSTRSWNLALLHFCAFLPSNFAAYYLNRLLVFTPGRHRFGKELTLFTLISFFSFSLGELLPFWLVNQLNVPNAVSHISFLAGSAMVNFIARKLLVFEK